jgi:hypothetical protein
VQEQEGWTQARCLAGIALAAARPLPIEWFGRKRGCVAAKLRVAIAAPWKPAVG